MKSVLILTAGLAGASVLRAPSADRTGAASAWLAQAAPQRADTARVRLHVSGMTCATCPATARVALRKLDGVYDATVTWDDSLAVVRYDPRRVTPGRITAHLKRLTGYVATVLPDSATPARRPRGG